MSAHAQSKAIEHVITEWTVQRYVPALDAYEMLEASAMLLLEMREEQSVPLAESSVPGLDVWNAELSDAQCATLLQTHGLIEQHEVLDAYGALERIEVVDAWNGVLVGTLYCVSHSSLWPLVRRT